MPNSIDPIARRATSRSVSLNELFARRGLLRYGLLSPNVFAAQKLRHSNSRRALAPVNPIARRATSRTVSLNELFALDRPLRYGPYRQTSSLHGSCGFAAALHRPVNPIARRATSRSVSINELFARHRLLRYGLLPPNVFAARKLRDSNSRRALAPVNLIARRATSRTVSLNELFARHRLLRYGLLPPNVFAARKLRHSNSRRALAPVNLIARRATSRTVSLNEFRAGPTTSLRPLPLNVFAARKLRLCRSTP